MRAYRVVLALGLLLLAGVAVSGTAMACELGTATNSGFSQDIEVAPKASVLAETHDEHASSGHHHPPGQHDHDNGCPNGCCVVCCGIAAPHVLAPATEFFSVGTVVPHFALAPSTEVAVKAVWLPYRPPRAA